VSSSSHLSPSHNTFASGGSDKTVSIWDHVAKKRMKQYTGFVNEISCLAFSPDGKYLAIGSSYEHDNGVPQVEERTRIGVQIKTTVMDDCRVGSIARVEVTDTRRYG
jgi:cell cycle arrest protein BUB3